MLIDMAHHMFGRIGWLICALALEGCAHFEFDIVKPAEFTAHVGSKSPLHIERAPLRYRMQAVEGRLVMWIDSPGPGSVRLLGDQSVVVDPDGASHPLESRTIAPGSFIKLVLPPMRPVVGPAGPALHFGVGTGGMHRIENETPAVYDRPVGLSAGAARIEDDAYWDWEGQTPVRMTLRFVIGEQAPFDHDWTILRKKM